MRKKLKTFVYQTGILGAASLVLGSQVTVSNASLIFLGDLEEVGEGFGAVDNILTLQHPGGAGDATDVESGKVAWDGTQDVLSGADVVPGQTSTFTFGFLGIADASEIIFGWNANEVGSPEGDDTQVDTLIMTIYDPGGDVFFAASLEDPVHHDDVFNPGVGGGDFFYGLDAAQTDIVNDALTAAGDFSLYRIGLEASVSFVDAGPDTWLIRKGSGSTPPPPPPDVPVPEPMALLIFGIGTAGLVGASRRKREQ